MFASFFGDYSENCLAFAAPEKVPDKMASGFMEIQSGAANLLSKPELNTKAAKNYKSG
ncbi:MAG: hypothetical protein M0P20_00990 [Methanocorpusculum sp.]|jgi:hypothetical protein|nr:hypothetical protein [Methanocorpusculum sp.]MDD3257012.1 hypothetical protein [Methanocorpusculum sp.]MDD4132422.1 hypothetical protein [Methanocorpusculum sp.]